MTTDTDDSPVPDPHEDRAVVLASGGMDSATAAYEALARGYDQLYLLHTTYGQHTADRERACAEALSRHVDAADLLVVDTSHLADIGASSLTTDAGTVDDADLESVAGTATEQSSGDEPRDSDGVPDSYVPFRNANLLSMAVSYAEANGCTAVFIGAHSEDYSGYPDCRPAFFRAFQDVVDRGTSPAADISIEAPFVDATKTDIAERGLELDVPYEDTWSCYRSEAPACGTCDACAYRLQAFQRAGVVDPIEYEQRPDYTD